MADFWEIAAHSVDNMSSLYLDCNISYFPFRFWGLDLGSNCFSDEALIAETMVWPNFFLMNVFFALKGSKLFIINS